MRIELSKDGEGRPKHIPFIDTFTNGGGWMVAYGRTADGMPIWHVVHFSHPDAAYFNKTCGSRLADYYNLLNESTVDEGVRKRMVLPDEWGADEITKGEAA